MYLRNRDGSRGTRRSRLFTLFELCCNIQTKTRSQVGRNISLIKRANEEKETRQTLLELRSGHDADVTVNVLAKITTSQNLASSRRPPAFLLSVQNKAPSRSCW